MAKTNVGSLWWLKVNISFESNKFKFRKGKFAVNDL